MGSKEKKRSKKISQGRKKKKGRSRSKKKISKKLRRQEDSFSESGDDSLSSASSSSYGSEEDVEIRQSRSRGRKDGKGRKKRVRSSSSSSEGGSDAARVKKRKSSKIKVDMGRKKKASKKHKKAASLSSTSSDEIDYEKSRGECKKKETHRRYDKKDKSKRGRKRYRASSFSSSSKSIESESKRKRHRSPSRSSLSTSSERGRDEKRKRYWSPSGSLLSRSGASSDQHNQGEIEVLSKPFRKLNSIIVVPKEPDQNSMSNEHKNELDMGDDERNTKCSVVEEDEHMEETKSGTEALVPVPDNEDLESILRRKALENLKKFRGGSKIEQKSDKTEISVTGVKQNAADGENIAGSGIQLSSPSLVEPMQDEFDKNRGLDVNYASQVADLVYSPEKEERLPSPSVNTENISFKNHAETKTDGSKYIQHGEEMRGRIPKAVPIVDNMNPSSLADKKSYSGNVAASRHTMISQPGKLSNVKLESDSKVKSQEPLEARPITKLSPQECLDSKPVFSKKSSETSVDDAQVDAVNLKSVDNIIKESSNTISTAVPNNPTSSLPTTVAGEHEHVSSDHQGQAEEGSQFQEKTMSVMRGGELIQVSYKVYIPKKAPPVARRRLMR